MFSGMRFGYGVLAGLWAFAAPVFAQETTASLQDPSYLPSEGHLISDTGFSYERFTNQAGYSYSSHSYVQSQSFEYGVAHGLVVGIGESCSYREETYRYPEEFFSSSFEFKDHNTGCNDPYVQATYRGFHQSDLPAFPVNLDVTASYAPNLLGARYGVINNASGGASGDVNVALSHVFPDITVLGRVGVSLTGKTKQAGEDGYYETQGAVARPYLDLELQYRPVDNLFLTGGVKAYPGYRQSETYTASAYTSNFTIVPVVQEISNKGGYDVTPYVGLAWTLIPDRLSASIRYQHSFEGDIRSYQNGFLVGEFIDNSSDYVAIDFRVLWF